jgi:hypothetical protein
MFQTNWPSSGVEVVIVKDSAAHCNAVFFPPIGGRKNIQRRCIQTAQKLLHQIYSQEPTHCIRNNFKIKDRLLILSRVCGGMRDENNGF